MNEKMEFFLHDMFMEIMSSLDTLEDYEETLEALWEGCLLNMSSDGETEEESAERHRKAEERQKQLEKEKQEAEKEREREAIERRIRLLDNIREFLLLNDISTIPGILPGLELSMFIPLKAVCKAVRKLHPDTDDKDIELDRNDRMLVKAELSRVRLRMEELGGGGGRVPKRSAKEVPVKEKEQEILQSPAHVKKLY
ncbi:MAG: hypothetical protein K5686_04310 [Lachnospiraceae bacterium]|nr:hypothetical protein [Lachnospiraceae bacterium]